MNLTADVLAQVPLTARTALALAAILLIAVAGRGAARALRQPEVIGEIVVGLLAGPAVIALFGSGGIHLLLPPRVFDLLKLVAQGGLALFLVGLAHELRTGASASRRGAVAWTALGALVPPLLAGLLLAGAVAWNGSPATRGGAPLPAFLLMTAVAMSVSSVPVLARLLSERGLSRSTAGRLALSAGVVVDGLGWLLLTVAVSLRSGSPGDTLRSLAAVGVGALLAATLALALRTRAAGEFVGRWPRPAAVAVGAAAIAGATAMAQLGMTAVFGAVLVGLALPGGNQDRWGPVVSAVTRAGGFVVPAFFVTTGITVLGGGLGAAPWTLILLILLLAFLGKGLGGYLGARLGGERGPIAMRVGILMNTRGLTELIVLQAALSSGILTTATVQALVVMTLVTTAGTGPLLNLLERIEQRRGTGVPLPLVDMESSAQ